MNVLVTGATGFIGSHLAEELLKNGHRVYCFVRKTSNTKWLEGLNVSLIEGDCRDADSLRRAVYGMDYVFHLAGLTKAHRENDFFEVNAGGTENLVHAVIAGNPGIKRLVFLSSLAAVGPSRTGAPLDEDCEPLPVSSYGKSKLQAERIVLGHSGSIPVTVLRPPAVYGPRDRDFHTLYKMVNRGIFLHWGECRYSLLYVADLVRAIIHAAESKEAAGGVFFVSDKTVYTNDEIAIAISDALGKKPIRLRIPKAAVPIIAGIGGRLGKNAAILRDRARELGHPNWTCDPSKAAKVLGFSSKVKINEGISWTANWYRINQWL